MTQPMTNDERAQIRPWRKIAAGIALAPFLAGIITLIVILSPILLLMAATKWGFDVLEAGDTGRLKV